MESRGEIKFSLIAVRSLQVPPSVAVQDYDILHRETAESQSYVISPRRVHILIAGGKRITLEELPDS